MANMLWPHRQQPREVGDMVEAQAKHWALKERGMRDSHPLTWPVVTISRELGDQDPSLGQNVAKRLGFAYWDHGIVLELVCHLHADRAATFKFDKRLREAIEALLGTGAAKAEVVLADYADEIRTIRSLVVRRGGVVVDGRGAQLLVDPGDALRVRLVTPFELRAHRLETREHVSFEAARRLMFRGDYEHAAFVLRAMGYDAADPATFDLIVNTVTYPGERALGLVLMAYFAKFGDRPLATQLLARGRKPGPILVLPPARPIGLTTSGLL
jgi:hypothetical protein